jgi:hypothetical protein
MLELGLFQFLINCIHVVSSEIADLLVVYRLSEGLRRRTQL